MSIFQKHQPLLPPPEDDPETVNSPDIATAIALVLEKNGTQGFSCLQPEKRSNVIIINVYHYSANNLTFFTGQRVPGLDCGQDEEELPNRSAAAFAVKGLLNEGSHYRAEAQHPFSRAQVFCDELLL
ncbi:hypothetical protein PoB_000425700 [Plakobranchus ocellatus]|uniref:GSKIP domain-containing protein n=1 Tax=Plakobranchus ocellatus TaxID=259542 RepID=A0AAV3Y6M1_9GAST|nr:hypothetical protein PoB_000425700 [Plakobranchus ocellatus]